MLKYGYSAFSFKIIVFFESSSSLSEQEQRDALISLEQRYIDLLHPEYNILDTAGSNLGHKMSEEAKAKISASKKGKPSHRRGSTHSKESKELIKQNNAKSKQVFVFDSNLVFISVFNSIADAASFTGVHRWKISLAVRTNINIPINGYIFRNSPIQTD